MNGITRARLVVLGLALLGTVALGPKVLTWAGPQEVASVQELKAQAAQAIRDGRFARTNELLAKAAELSHSPSDEHAAQWTRHFEDQRQEFDVERQKQCERQKHHQHCQDMAGRQRPERSKERTPALVYQSRGDGERPPHAGIDSMVKTAHHNGQPQPGRCGF